MPVLDTRDERVFSATQKCAAILLSGLVATSILGCGGAQTEPAGTSLTAAETSRSGGTPGTQPMQPTQPPTESATPGLAANGWVLGSVGASVPGPVLQRREQMKFGPPPPALPPGATVAVIEGDPSASGKLFTLRIRVPDGYRIAPHWHLSDEHITVVSGNFRLGMGDTADATRMETVPAGGFAILPARHHHYAMAQGESEIQVHAVGPWKIIYVNPADDPSRLAIQP